jgi:hypothetical protein
MFSKYTVGEDTYGDLSIAPHPLPCLMKSRVTLLEQGITQHKAPPAEDYFCKSFPVIPTQHIMRNHGYHRKKRVGCFQKNKTSPLSQRRFSFHNVLSKYTKNSVWVQYARRDREAWSCLIGTNYIPIST